MQMGIHGLRSVIVISLQFLPIFGKGFHITVILRFATFFFQDMIQTNSSFQTFVVTRRQIVLCQSIDGIGHGISIFRSIHYLTIGIDQPIYPTVLLIYECIDEITLRLVGKFQIGFISKCTVCSRKAPQNPGIQHPSSGSIYHRSTIP